MGEAPCCAGDGESASGACCRDSSSSCSKKSGGTTSVSCCGGPSDMKGETATSCCASKTTSCSSSSNAGKNVHHDHQHHHLQKETAEEAKETISHDHHHKHSHHDNKKDENTSLCLALVRENGTDVVLFDRAGVPRTFQYQATGSGAKNSSTTNNITTASSTATTPQLCFGNHGSDRYDDLLTPCLDEDGRHGVPSESCFCGVETPHLHAHLRDPKTCHENEGTQRQQNVQIGKLASHILHPADEDENGDDFEVAAVGASSSSLSHPFHMPISDRMPQQCNFSQALRSASGGGGGGGATENDNKNSNKSSDHSNRKQQQQQQQRLTQEHPARRRLHAIRHGDHLDFLVHNSVTGNLHLEHPGCRNCGNNDIHGRFDKVGQRRLQTNDVNIHFFQVASKPFNILDCLTDLFQFDTDARVHAVEHMFSDAATTAAITDTEHSHSHEHQRQGKTAAAGTSTEKKGNATTSISEPTIVRSTFKCTEICCPAEIPMIQSVLQPVAGLEKIMINVPLKQVNIDHDLAQITAAEITAVLRPFGATISRDGGATNNGSNKASILVQSELSLVPSTSNRNCKAIQHETEALTAFLQTMVDASHVHSFVVDVTALRVTVMHNPFGQTAPQIAAQISQQYHNTEVVVSLDGADPAVWDYPYALQDPSLNDNSNMSANDAAAVKGASYPRPTVVASGVLWVVSMLSLVGGKWEHLKWVALVSVAFGIPPIALKAFRTMRRYQFDTNCLMFFASVGAIALQDFTEAAAVVFLFALSEWLEVRATSRARQALAAIVDLRPEQASLVHPFTQELLTVPATSVPVGALVSVITGEKIPCDGVVVGGISTVDESSLTGESRPIRKGPKDKVSGGTVNSGLSPLMVRTTSTSDDSAVSRLIRLVEEAQANRSETEKIVDEFAKVYTPIVVLSALLMCSVSWLFGREAGRQWTENGLILIVVACPCALIISTPVTYVAGLAAAAQKGILIKGGATLEALGAVKMICMDKTGTLTNGAFCLLQTEVLTEALSREEVFQYLALMEERASHPVAQAILTAAQHEKVVLPKKMLLQKHKIINGEGVVGVVDGHEVHVGNERLFERLGLLTSLSANICQMVEEWKILGGTIGYMSIEGHGIVCAYCAADGIREESEMVVKRLRDMKISVTMLTGDNFDAALAIGKQVGLPRGNIMAKLLPEEKLQFVESLSQSDTPSSIIRNLCKRKQLVMHVGDGVNDAPALAAADVGVAMGEGAALSMETSDVTLLDSNLMKILSSINLGSKVSSKIMQNIVFSLTVKILVLGFALAGMTSLWAAIASDVGAMLLVTLNAMLLLPNRQPKEDDLAIKRKGDVEEGGVVGASNAVRLIRDAGTDCDNKSSSSSTSCSKGCCSSEIPSLMEFFEVENTEVETSMPHAKGCCSNSSCDPEKPKTEEKYDKGCCGDASEPVEQPPPELKTCAKGCCGSSSSTKVAKAHYDDSIAHSHQHQPTKDASSEVEHGPNNMEACAKECFGSFTTTTKDDHPDRAHSHQHQLTAVASNSVEHAPNDAKLCAKGCSLSSSVTKDDHADQEHSTSQPHQHQHSVIQESVKTEACAKGCCGGSSTGNNNGDCHVNQDQGYYHRYTHSEDSNGGSFRCTYHYGQDLHH